MTDRDINPSIAALRKLEASLTHGASHAETPAGAPDCGPLKSGGWLWRRHMRRLALVCGPLLTLMILVTGAVWWRLASGPIALDLATPWITAAIQENFGPGHQVEIGGTQLERDENGNTAIRIRDIVVRHPDGSVVASAPKAEVGVSGASLLTARVRAERLSLVGAEMAVRIESDGNVTVFAGANSRPIATAVAGATSVPFAPVAARVTGPMLASNPADPAPAPTARVAIPDFVALMAWIDGLGVSGLDGHDLSELGLKNGNLVVDDRRTGKHVTFENIDLSLSRSSGGGVGFTLGSENPAKPWRIGAALTPAPRGHRLVSLDAQRVPLRDLLLALRLGEGQFEPDIPISAQIRLDIGPDGVPQMIEGRLLAESGTVTEAGAAEPLLAFDRIETSLDWDMGRRTLSAPIQVVAGGNRVTMLAQIDAPADNGGVWSLKLSGGSIVLAEQNATDPLVFNRIQARFRVDPVKRRIDVEQGDLGNLESGIALSGSIDYSEAEPRVAIGLAGNRMSLVNFKRLWPVLIAPPVRSFVMDRFLAGTIERVVIATNAPLSAFKVDGPPFSNDELTIEMVGSAVTLRPIGDLPPLRDADVTVTVVGKTANVNVARANLDVPSGKKLTLTNGSFQIPDTSVSQTPARVRFRLDGAVPAVAELLTLGPLRDQSAFTFDPATSKGNVSAQASLGLALYPKKLPDITNYTVTVDATNFAAEKMLLGQKLEATALRVVANAQAFQVKGDVKISGVPASVDYKKPRGDGDAEVRIQTVMDEAARARFGFNTGAAISGPVGVKLTGRIPANEQDARFAVEADLVAAKLDNLIPGWVKPAGKPGKATFTLSTRDKTTRFDDLAIDGSSALVRGAVEVDNAGELISANFPVFSLSDGDKASLKAERGTDGTLKVTMRGDVYDGRAFVKLMVAGNQPDKSRPQAKDLDLDIKVGAVAGYFGETMRALDLRMSRRGGVIRNFVFSGKLGRDAPINGDLRVRPGTRQVMVFETGDAGALFRFADIYPRIYGGDLVMVMDPPAMDNTPSDGQLIIRDFTVRGEPNLDRVASGGSNQRGGVEFNRMSADFTKTTGRFQVRDGVVRGPVIGATIDGLIDYTANEVHMRGTFVPLYGLNNMFGQIPLVGLFLGGGSNEGLVGITYEVVGAPNAPVLRVNPISAVAPGLLRKFFEFPTNLPAPQSFAEPSR